MLPNLLIVGAQKCGTTSLHQYLDLHPEVSMSKPKELDFFIARDPARFSVGNWNRGVDWYESHFTDATPIRGEASPNYTVYPFTRDIPERAASLLGDARIIYLVRDPIDRIVSQYLHRRATGLERRPLEDTLADIDLGSWAMNFVYRSMYFMQLERWLENFAASRVLVLEQDELRDRRVVTLDRVFRFLDVDPSFRHERFEALGNVSAEKRPPTRAETRLRRSRPGTAAAALPAAVRRPASRALRALGGRRLERPPLSEGRREALRALLADDVARLRAFTGRSFSTWSV